MQSKISVIERKSVLHLFDSFEQWHRREQHIMLNHVDDSPHDNLYYDLVFPFGSTFSHQVCTDVPADLIFNISDKS